MEEEEEEEEVRTMRCEFKSLLLALTLEEWVLEAGGARGLDTVEKTEKWMFLEPPGRTTALPIHSR